MSAIVRAIAEASDLAFMAQRSHDLELQQAGERVMVWLEKAIDQMTREGARNEDERKRA